MRESIIINLPEEIRSVLDEVTSSEGISTDDLISEAIKEYIFFRRLRLLRENMIAKAKKQGIYTDQDVFNRVS